MIQDVGRLESADCCFDLEPTVGAVARMGTEVVVLVDPDGWPGVEDDVGVACRKMTMRPSEWAEKIASTTISSSTMAATR